MNKASDDESQPGKLTEYKRDETEEEEMDDDDNPEDADDGTEHEDEHSLQAQKSSPLTAQQRARHAITGRGVTLSMLMDDKIIEPGENNMSIDYLGQKFTADLLSDGRIQWREEDKVFGSPSAWALHCKKIVNPSKKSGCGWASVRYKGKKLDWYKSSWVRKQKPAISSLVTHSSDGIKDEMDEGETEEENDCKKLKLDTEDDTSDNECESVNTGSPIVITAVNTPTIDTSKKISVRHGSLGRRSNVHDQTTMVECHTFAQLGKMQPFNIKIRTNSMLVMDFHCHLTTGEVIGYLGGKWDINTQYLSVVRAFPLKCRLGDSNNSANVENQVRCSMEDSGLALVGWYHSHPKCQPDPSLRDIESQMEYQMQLRGPNASYHPCLGLIISPYNPAALTKESQMRAFWVMPPPEQRPLDYGMPMSMQYEVSQDEYLSDELIPEMKGMADFYRGEPDLIDLKTYWSQEFSYLEKLKISLKKKLPKKSVEQVLFDELQAILT